MKESLNLKFINGKHSLLVQGWFIHSGNTTVRSKANIMIYLNTYLCMIEKIKINSSVGLMQWNQCVPIVNETVAQWHKPKVWNNWEQLYCLLVWSNLGQLYIKLWFKVFLHLTSPAYACYYFAKLQQKEGESLKACIYNCTSYHCMVTGMKP